MICKKCKAEIPENSLYCNLCGAAQKRDKKKKLYQRPDGLYEKTITINGKRKVFRAKTESEINKKILEFQETKEKGRLFSDVAESWYQTHFENLEYNSKKNYRPAYRRAVEHFRDTPIKEISANNANAFIIDFARQGFAQKTVRTQLLVLNLIFSKAVVDGDLEYNPAQYVKIPKNLPKSSRNLPSDEDIEKVKKSVTLPFGLFAYFLLYSGCRRGEALALQYKDVDRNKKIISITKSIYYDNNHPMIKRPKTEAGNRAVILLDKLAAEIPEGKPNDFIFSDNGIPLTQSQFEVKWRQYKKAAKLQITPHQLRHAFATILFEAGIDVKDAQELLGHSSIAMTRDIYTHIRASRKDQTAQQLNDYIGL